MKITIKKLEDMTPEERAEHLREQQEIADRLNEGESLEEIFEGSKSIKENTEEFRKASEGVKEIVIPEDVAFNMRANGIDPEEIARMLVKAMKKQH